MVMMRDKPFLSQAVTISIGATNPLHPLELGKVTNEQNAAQEMLNERVMMAINGIRASSLLIAASTGMATAQTPPTFELRSNVETFSSQNSTIQGLHGITVLHDFGNNIYAGQSLYSAALGDAGGAFFWGFEAATRLPQTARTSLSIQGFLGGGGGAGEVPGDGLMSRLYAGGSYNVAEHFALDLGASHVRILGSPVDTLSYSLGITYRPEAWTDSGGHPTNNVVNQLSAIRASVRSFTIDDDRRARDGSQQDDVTLAGAEIAFATHHAGEFFVNADGAIAGDGEGYMNVLGGYRFFADLGAIRPYVDASIGFGGGGDLDTGAGLLLSAGVGAAVGISADFDVLGGVQRVYATNGDFAAWSPYLRGSVNLGRRQTSGGSDQNSWQLAYSAAMTHQFANDDFRKLGDRRDASPTLNATAIDVYFNDNLYFTGEAQTVMYGDAGGYALGILGAGYKFELADRWDLSLEALVGAAGGGGVATHGGLIAGARAEIDYALTETFLLSVGVGYLQTIKGDGMAPVTMHVGIKIPFELGG